MKKNFCLFLSTIICLMSYGQNQSFEILPYSPYVADSLEYPVTVPPGSVSILDYARFSETGIVHRDTIPGDGSFNVRILSPSDLISFSVFNETRAYGVHLINWICIHPEGDSNILLVFDERGDCCKYDMFDDNGKVLRKGKVENGYVSMSLKGVPNGDYWIEFVTESMECCISFRFSVNQWNVK